ncbi:MULTISPECIES: PAS domain-containing sensor histidine kinase [Methylobacterium]|uniref:histidine kinase n=1 Tax=Methylobacterium thuringiense TaxID=1003091 RepID=A0ABQ4TFT9_9HYPH|nr:MULTISPECIES: PAS domain-containing sensor histidine kinase [Methylobacterium]TXN24818.1 response regulator [Methylobacterium sp. WL9]GJE54269.1 Blue-light-activated protein [Methylobacterium thuringiense]
MSSAPDSVADKTAAEADRARIRELEARLEESEETLAAIRRGDFDAVVVQGPDDQQRVYTLESADRPYRVLIEQIQEGALTLSADGLILYCNRRMTEMLGLRQERLIGQPFHSFVAADDGPTLKRLLREAADGSARAELCLQAIGGTNLPANVSLSQLERDDTAPLLCGVVTDLTQQKLHLHELAEANARLRAQSEEREQIEDALRQAQKMEAVGQLTGGIAHDFNNLLTIIKSSTDLLRRPDLAPERHRRYVDAIADTVERAARLTGQLLAFARRQSLKPETFDVNDRVHRIIEMLGTIVGARIRIERALHAVPCCIEADVSQFETALVNLAVNARDAMEGEGVLRLRVFCGAKMPAQAGQQAEAKPFVAVAVTDTGCGIPPDRIGRIFEPFFTTKEVGKGTGLGLSQVFGFAKQSGGTVGVESALGKGSTFTLYLPQVEPGTGPEQAAPSTRGIQRDSGGGRRVLVVEDNADVGAFSTQLLQDLGYATTWAARASDALLLLVEDASQFDVVFSDVVMPGMNGVEMAREIRRLYPTLPVVLTSGYSHILVEEGPQGFELLRKPYAVEDLSRVLRKITRQHGS